MYSVFFQPNWLYLGLKTQLVWKKIKFMWENVKNLRNHLVGRCFHNETKACKTFHCVLGQTFLICESRNSLLEKLVDDEAEAKLAVDLDSCWKLELEADAALVEKVCCWPPLENVMLLSFCYKKGKKLIKKIVKIIADIFVHLVMINYLHFDFSWFSFLQSFSQSSRQDIDCSWQIFAFDLKKTGQFSSRAWAVNWVLLLIVFAYYYNFSRSWNEKETTSFCQQAF